MGSQINTITVAQDGPADHRTVQEAVDAVRYNNNTRTVIRVAPGKYPQPVYVPKNKNRITLAGLWPETTVLTFNNTETKIEPRQPPLPIGTGTFASGTFIVEGEDFIAENISFENSDEGSGPAVAVRVTADRCAFYNCRFLGRQDTLYLHYGKQYLRDCYIEGSVDFICGDSAALFENCHIHCKSNGYITAQQRSKTSKGITGYVFLRCKITGNGGKSYTYLGRPWDDLATVVFAYSYMDTCVRPDGWCDWPEHPERQTTACFREYKCFGPGSSSSNRVQWARQLNDDQARQFLSDGFVDPDWQRPWLQIGSLK